MNKEKNLYYIFAKAERMEDIMDIEGVKLDSRLEGTHDEISFPLHSMRLAENYHSSIITRYGLKGLMSKVAKNRDKSVFVVANRNDPETAGILIDSDNQHSYSLNETLYIPVPKKFAVLEPDKNYFEMTLKANIFLALLEADEEELHR